MKINFLGLDFTVYQCWVLVGCPVAGLLGSYIRALMIRNTLEELPSYPLTSKPLTFAYFWVRTNWYYGWSVVGFATGSLVGLLFLGELADSVGSVTRVIAVALLAGYGAPAIWKKQQDLIANVVEQRVKSLYGAFDPDQLERDAQRSGTLGRQQASSGSEPHLAPDRVASE